MAHRSRLAGFSIDIASNDVAAEVARLEAPGAKQVAAIRTWVVMEAPTGHRFCVIRARRLHFAATSNAWD